MHNPILTLVLRPESCRTGDNLDVTRLVKVAQNGLWVKVSMENAEIVHGFERLDNPEQSISDEVIILLRICLL